MGEARDPNSLQSEPEKGHHQESQAGDAKTDRGRTECTNDLCFWKGGGEGEERERMSLNAEIVTRTHTQKLRIEV